MSRDLVGSREELSRALALASEVRADLEREVSRLERSWRRRLRIILKAPSRFPKVRFAMGLFGGFLLGGIVGALLRGFRP